MIQDKHMVLSGPIPPIQRKPLAYIRSSTKRPTHAGGWYLSAYIYLFVVHTHVGGIKHLNPTCVWQVYPSLRMHIFIYIIHMILQEHICLFSS
jgi:hypothetical protein